MMTKDVHRKIENILLMGCDVDKEACFRETALTEAEKRFHTDAIVVLSLNRENGQIKLVSLMRDIWVSIPGYGMGKLNVVFRRGGPELIMKVVNDAFHLNVRNYVLAGMDDMVRIVDLFGGVTMEISDEEAGYINDRVPEVLFLTERGGDIPSLEKGGRCHLCGVQAVAHVRNRTIGYIEGRENRIHDLIRVFAAKARDEMSTPQLLITGARSLKYVRTNIGILKGLSLVRSCLKADLSEVKTYHAPKEGTYVVKRDGTWRMETDFSSAALYLWFFLLS